LQAVQEIDRALSVGGGGEDGALVLFQDLEPVLDIGGIRQAGTILLDRPQILG